MNNELVVKGDLTDELALKEIENAVRTLKELKPVKPTWFKEGNGNMLIRGAFKDDISSNDIIAIPLMGSLLGFMGAVLFSDTYVLPLIISGMSAILALSVTLPYFLADSYGGSRMKQPVRKFFAKRLRKNRMELLERRVKEYEQYQKALELHQVVIEDMRQELNTNGVFQLLSKDGKQHLINNDGKHEISIVDYNKLPREYLKLSQKMIEYLNNKNSKEEFENVNLNKEIE